MDVYGLQALLAPAESGDARLLRARPHQLRLLARMVAEIVLRDGIVTSQHELAALPHAPAATR